MQCLKIAILEALLKTIRSTTDVVAHHLSDELFDLVLGIVYDYATTTARANAVKAFGNLVSSLAKANSKKVLAKFLPYCTQQILVELEHGASSVRTTSVGLAIPSDTALHWRKLRYLHLVSVVLILYTYQIWLLFAELSLVMDPRYR